MLILKPQGEISDKKSVHLYIRVNRFVCNILDIIHSSNSVLSSGGGGWGVFFFWKIYVTIVLQLEYFDTKIKQHMISTDSINSIT